MATSNAIVVTYETGYTVTYDCNGGTSGCPDPLVVNNVPAGEYTLASEPSRPDYTFEGWNDGTTTYAAGATYPISQNVTFTAQWTPTFDYINVAPTSFEVPVEGGVIEMTMTTNLASPSYVVVYYTTAACTEPTDKPAWFGDVEFSGNTLDIEVNENDGAARLAYFKVKSGDVESEDVVTVSQAAITVATPTFDVAAGTYYEDQLVDITCATTGAAIYYTTDGTTPAANNGTEYDGNGVEITANTTLKAIAIKNSVSSEVATATYTIIHPLTTMDAIFEASATQGSYYVTMNNWVVTGVNGKQAFVTDGTKGFLVYKNASGNNPTGFVVGNKLSGTVYVSLTRFNGSAEFTDLTASTTGLNVTTGGTVTPQVVTIDAMSGVNTGALIQLNGVTYNGTVLVDENNNTIIPYTTLYTGSYTNGTKYNIVGVYQQQSNAPHRIMPRSAADIVEVQDPTITTVASLAVPNYVVGTADPEYETLIVNGSFLTDDITLSLGNGSNFEMSTDLSTWSGSLTLPQTNGSVTNAQVAVRLKAGLSTGDYQGTITLTSTGADDVTVALTGSVTNPTYTITDLTGSWGHIEFNPSTPVEANAQVELTVVPGDAYYFDGKLMFYNGTELIETVTGASNPYIYTMPAHNVNVAAELWSKPQYAITTIVTPTEGGTVVTDEHAWVGKTVEIMVEANVGYALQSLTATYEEFGETQELTITNNTFVMPGYPVTVTAIFEEMTEVTYDFTKIEGFSDWGTSYAEHVVEYPTATVTFASANRQTSTITDRPVTKGNPVIIVMKDDLTLTSAAFQCTQWDNKTQTITLHYSTDGGENFTSTGVTSTNFSINSNLPAGTNAVKITFSSTSNQVGIASATVNIQSGSIEYYTLSLGNHDHINEYFMFVGNENNSVEFEDDEIEVAAGSTVYVSVAEVEDCYFFNGIDVIYGDNQKADTTKYDPMYYSFEMPAADATLNFVTSQAPEHTLTVDQLSHVTLDLTAGEDSHEVQSGDNVCEGLHVTISATAEQGYVLQSVVVVDGDEDPVEVTEVGNGIYWFIMPSSAVTINALAMERTLNTYTLATTIAPGTYLITNGSSKAMGKQNTNNRAAANVDINAGVAAVNSDDEDVYEFIIDVVSSGSETLYSIQDARSSNYLCATNSSSNYLKEEATLSDYSKWAINIENGVPSIVAQDGSRNVMRFNSSSNLFSCYAANNNQQDIYLYKKNENTAPQTINDENIVAYEGDGGYALIATPVIGVIPTANNGFLTNEYDLYYFDQSQEGKEWRNFKASSFNLISGKGYLYANSGDNGNTTLTFSGTPYNGSGEVALDYTASVYLVGWNLIGNPYASNATVNKPYYRLNSDGSALNTSTEEDPIAIMEGVFVKATGANQTATFTAQNAKSEKKNTAKVELMLNGNKGIIDNAIVRFDEGETLEKFVLRENSTKLYFTEDNQDYAIVRSNGQGEMPVNFKAENNGTYTLSVNAENVEMTYLHLIDNMTGADIDLLATPSYSFEAKKSDYASRFRLVFSGSSTSSETAETFAYYNGSEWVINNMGDATLQVADVMGRVLSSETVSGNATLSTSNLGAGVYVMRLINGENVMTQKIVVR